MPRLIIAEKPAMARDIARHLPGPHTRHDGYIETGAGWVTSCVGHLLEQVEPGAYEDRWLAFPGNYQDLPIIPTQWKMRPVESKSRYLKVIKGLLGKCSEVINAGDPGREGQLIIDEVLEYLGNTKPVKRVILSKLNAQAITREFANLHDNAEFANLHSAALARQRADWLIGMNMTRAYTILGRQQQGYRGVLSIGRVQTPTLGIVVRRETEIASFVSVRHWTLEAELASGTNPFWASWVPPGATLSDKPKATTGEDDEDDAADETADTAAIADPVGSNAALATNQPSAHLPARPDWLDAADRVLLEEPVKAVERAIRAAGTATVMSANRHAVPEAPPLLFTLNSLQVSMERLHAMSGKAVLDACQALYQAGFQSYPRTDSPHLTNDEKPEVPQVLVVVRKVVPEWGSFFDIADPNRPTALWNDAAAEEHGGLIPTSTPPDLASLPPDQRHVWREVACRYLAQFLPDCQTDRTRLIFDSAGHRLVASGRIITSPGWRSLYSLSAPTAQQDPALPDLAIGQVLKITDTKLSRHDTKPPLRYTEASLRKVMEQVSRLVSDPVLRRKLKAVKGIGRAATRTQIIENLIARDLLRKQGRHIVPSPAATMLIAAAPPPLSDPALTAQWEHALDAIAAGRLDMAVFHDKQAQWVTKLLARARVHPLPLLLADPSPPSHKTAARQPRKSTSTSSRKSAPGSKTSTATASTSQASTANSTCPACGKGTMQARIVRKEGPNHGKSFLSCSRYPECRHSIWPK